MCGRSASEPEPPRAVQIAATSRSENMSCRSSSRCRTEPAYPPCTARMLRPVLTVNPCASRFATHFWISASLATPPGAMSPTSARGARRGGLTSRLEDGPNKLGTPAPARPCEAAGKAVVAAKAATNRARSLRSSLALPEAVGRAQDVGTPARIGHPRIPACTRGEVEVVRGEGRILVQQVLDAAGDREVPEAGVRREQVVRDVLLHVRIEPGRDDAGGSLIFVVVDILLVERGAPRPTLVRSLQDVFPSRIDVARVPLAGELGEGLRIEHAAA